MWSLSVYSQPFWQFIEKCPFQNDKSIVFEVVAAIARDFPHIHTIALEQHVLNQLLTHAVSAYHSPVTRLLINSGANPFHRDELTGKNYLHYICSHYTTFEGSEAAVVSTMQALLEASLLVNQADNEGFYPVYHVLQSADKEDPTLAIQLISMLIEKGASLDSIQDPKLETGERFTKSALEQAYTSENAKVVESLIGLGAGRFINDYLTIVEIVNFIERHFTDANAKELINTFKETNSYAKHALNIKDIFQLPTDELPPNVHSPCFDEHYVVGRERWRELLTQKKDGSSLPFSDGTSMYRAEKYSPEYLTAFAISRLRALLISHGYFPSSPYSITAQNKDVKKKPLVLAITSMPSADAGKSFEQVLKGTKGSIEREFDKLDPSSPF